MKRLFALALALSFAIVSAAQTRETSVDALLAGFSGKDACLSASFTLKLAEIDKVPLQYEGTIFWQDGWFRVTGRDYAIFCNSAFVWTVDYVSKEVVQDEASGLSDIVPDGTVRASYSPDGKRLEAISITTEKGTVEITVPSMEFIPLKEESFFTLDVSALPEDFVLTSLN